jgi:signal transduction histidine kinase/DNA-binding response OmpR family regulator
MSQPGGDRLFLGHSELARLMAGLDWDATPIGRPQHWPHSLGTAVRIMLTSQQPIWIGWGKDLTYLYNDPYKSIIGGKHPWALGRPTAEVWREIWGEIAPLLDKAMTEEEGTYVEEQLLIMERHGYPEETHYTFSYSPIIDDDGTTGGIFCANTDDTQRVIGERQLALLRELAAGTAHARTWQQACENGAYALSTNPRDLPFALLYVLEPGSEIAMRAGATGIDLDHPSAPETISIQSLAPWPLTEALQDGNARLVTNLSQHFGTPFPRSVWKSPPHQAIVLPIPASGETGRTGFLIAGLNPFRLPDDNYKGFLSLAASQIGAAIGNAEAYQYQQQRAEALAQIDRAKTAFFSNISHEFRTPLTLMLGPLEETLAQPSLPPQQLQDLSLVHRNGLRLLKLVNRLLDFSRIEAGRMQASFEKVDLAALTADIASNFSSVTERVGLTLIVDCPPLPDSVYVDRDMWEKIVLNLMSNAFKFTLVGQITVCMRASDNGSAARFSVIDTGIGISADEFPRLFERFRRIEGARRRSFEGSGIGLALVQELVKLHGGDISVESQPGVGSTFTVAIPFGTAHLPDHGGHSISEAADREPAVASTNARPQAYINEALGWSRHGPNDCSEVSTPEIADNVERARVTSNGQRYRVVLADDNADMRDYAGRLLRDAGFDVDAAPDGETALEIVRHARPDLVLSDVMMPKLDGFGLLSRMRADSELSHIPVLLLSARAGEEAKVEGLGSGADDYLTKPFSARELIARVEGNLRLARARREKTQALVEEAKRLETLNRIGNAIAAELDIERMMQVVTDAATELSGAAYGSFFYNVLDERGESYSLSTLSGAPREAFSKFPQPRNTEVFGPTFRGEGIVRSTDITQDPRFGKNDPYRGMPPGHLPVRSYLAAPVKSQSGEVLGGLFFGHPEVGIFDERSERLIAGVAVQAGIAMDRARLYHAAQDEIVRRKRIEAALRESEQSLESKVKQRTRELTAANDQLLTAATERERVESQLRQAQKMEAMGQLTGGVAHDFNNLLTIVIGNVESMQRNLPADALPRQRRWIENAMHGAKRAATLTQHLLAFSRKQPLNPKPVDLNQLVSDISQILSRTLGEQIKIQSVLSRSLWKVEIDITQMETSLLNLAVNARDAMPDGGRLTIETANAHLDESYALQSADDELGQYVVLAVTDTGVGMSEDVLQHAFEPFYTTKPTGKGTGLGLSQVYGFVKQSGGHVRLYSKLGEGTSVRIYLPRFLGSDSFDTEAISMVPDAKQMETVLVVEDEPGVREHSAELLRELGYSVIEAQDAQDALRKIERTASIDLLFTDIGLPGMNGRQLVEEALRRRPQLKVLYTTGYARNAVVHHGRLDPGVQLITKPFTYANLAARVRDVLDT